MASYNGTLVDSPHRAEDTLRCSATIQGLSVLPITFPPEEVESVIPIAQSSLTYVQQEELEIAYEGTYIDSFLQDYYYRVHISPAAIAFGAIVNPIEETFIVWNAWFETKTCSDVAKTNDTEYTLTPDDSSFSLVALEAETFTLNVDENGATEFIATITFTFSGETPVLRMTGTRVAVFPFEPSIPMMENLTWQTDIIRAIDGTEQRISIRPVPRQGFKFEVVLKTEQEQARLDALLFTWMKRSWGVPIWGELEEHIENISVDDTVINIDTTNADFRDDSYAIIWQGFDSYESIKIETVADNSLTLETHILNNWTGLKWIMPLRIAYMLSPSSWVSDADELGRFSCDFTIKDNELITTYSAPTEYESSPVLDASLVEGGLENKVENDAKFTDYGIDTFTMFSDSNFNIYVQRHIFRLNGKENIWKFREFLHYLYGRRNTIWISTDKNDFQQTEILGAAETELTVANVGWARNMSLNILRTHIAFTFPDGTLYHKEITGITESGDEEIIGLSSALGIEVGIGDCVISLLDKCRLTEDKVELEWQERQRLICRTNFTKVIE